MSLRRVVDDVFPRDRWRGTIRATMAQLTPDQYLSPDEQLRLQRVEKELGDLHSQRKPLAEKLRTKQNTPEEEQEVRRLNVEINRLTQERKSLYDKNRLLAKNQPGCVN